jgi:hypothetical protein
LFKISVSHSLQRIGNLTPPIPQAKLCEVYTAQTKLLPTRQLLRPGKAN